jgi:hypothetical protein
MRRLITSLAIGAAGLAALPLTAKADTTTSVAAPATIQLAPSDVSSGVDFCIAFFCGPNITIGGGGGGSSSYSCSVSGALQPASGGPQTYTVTGSVRGNCTGDGSITISACLQQATAYAVLPWGGAYPTAWGGDQSCTQQSAGSTASVSMSPSWWVSTPGCQAWVRMDMYVTGNNGVDPIAKDNEQSDFIPVGTGSYC